LKQRPNNSITTTLHCCNIFTAIQRWVAFSPGLRSRSFFGWRGIPKNTRSGSRCRLFVSDSDSRGPI